MLPPNLHLIMEISKMKNVVLSVGEALITKLSGCARPPIAMQIDLSSLAPNECVILKKKSFTTCPSPY